MAVTPFVPARARMPLLLIGLAMTALVSADQSPQTPAVAFEVNDGYMDVMGTARGVPAPPSDVANASPDVVEPDFVDAALFLPIDQRYSFVRRNAQTLDHLLLSHSAPPLFAGPGASAHQRRLPRGATQRKRTRPPV